MVSHKTDPVRPLKLLKNGTARAVKFEQKYARPYLSD